MLRWHIVVPTIVFVILLSSSCSAQSRRGELRGAWMEAEYGRDWAAIMSSLADSGFNAALPNLSVGNLAFYPSEVLQVAPGGEPGRDELAEAAKAAGARRVELHVWRIGWALLRTPPELLEELDSAGRLQRNSRGERGRDDPGVGADWLCPSHPENRKLEREATLELVRRYNIAGVQLDDFRFPSDDYCFCEHCRAEFQKEVRATIERWPDDVITGGPHAEEWREWRRRLLTGLVEEISDEAHLIKPEVCISLAAWPRLEEARESLGQDWPGWVRAKALDFVCPKDFTTDRMELTSFVEAQVAATRGEIPLYAGLAAWQMKSAGVLGSQVEAARAAGADGFVAFAYGSGELAKWLPQLRSTVAAADPHPMPHRAPPARFAFGGPGAEAAERGQVVAGAVLQVELSVGERLAPELEEEPDAGAAQAASMLGRITETRTPVASYGEDPNVMVSMGEERRISGRIVAETPSGIVLYPLGAFEADLGMERELRFPCPEGPFRVAVYGVITEGEGESHDFVVRGPLLTGVTEEELHAKEVREDLSRFWGGACERPEMQRLAHLNVTVQVEATEPGEGRWWLRLSDGKCESGEGWVEKADVSVMASGEDLLALARGESSPLELWEAGRLRAAGDPRLLRELAEALGL